MAGHSKWANIQHRKSRQDGKRARLFSRLVREVSVAARIGGADPDANARLRASIDAAVAANIPRDTVHRAIAKATGGDNEAANIEEIRYEGYGPAGVAFIVDCQTDNRNRTVAEVRHVFTKAGGNLGTAGSVSHLFRRCANFVVTAVSDHDKLLECVTSVNADDFIERSDGSIEIIAAAEDYNPLHQALQTAGFSIEQSAVRMRPLDYVQADSATVVKIQDLLDRLDEIDDVQNIYCNIAMEELTEDA